MLERGLEYLVASQSQSGSWENDAGVTGICVMALMSSGEDPNFGRYAESVRRGVRSMVRSQSSGSGQIGSGMYQHGFAMLALAECYGAVDERMLAEDGEAPKRTVVEALELAVRCAITSQEKNPFNAWRYSPSSTDADTSVSGAVLMGLLGARNAGIAVPDVAIDDALAYFESMTSSSGTVGYSGVASFGDSVARSSIAALVACVGKRRGIGTFDALEGYVVKQKERLQSGSHPCYARYYLSQALFQLDHAAWKEWAALNTRDLVTRQESDGSLPMPGSFHGPSYQTGMLLLSSALGYTLLPIYER
ncbi:MAG: squalene--hopene cyclase [Planctomycetota bacterium]